MSDGPAGPAGLTAAGDPQSLLDGLADGVARALPAGVDDVLDIERDRSFADRVAGRPGRVSSLRLTGPDLALTLRADGGGRRLVGEALRAVRGVVISRRTLPLGEWLTTLAGQVAALAAEAAGDAAAAGQALTALGVQPAGSDLAVNPADIESGLRALPALVEGRVPDEAAAAVRRVADLLLEALPRVAGSFDAEDLLRRTATTYLPDTLRAYLALPADWARSHVLPDGRTAADALLTQLAVLESAARDMRDDAAASQASALLVNGGFLQARFGTSELDLPH